MKQNHSTRSFARDIKRPPESPSEHGVMCQRRRLASNAWRRSARLLLVMLSLTFAGAVMAATTWTVTTTADDAPPGNSCNGHACLTLRDAIHSAADGDNIVFDLSGYTLPATITLANGQPLSIVGKSLTVDGPGFDKLTINAGLSSRIFDEPDASSGDFVETLSHLTLFGGKALGAAGSDATTAGAAGGPGLAGVGGCVYVGLHYTVHLDFDRIWLCYAAGGNGGNGATGATGVDGTNGASSGASGGPGGQGNTGSAGGAGGAAYGGAVYVRGSLMTDSSTFEQNVALGGGGGNGGMGGTGGPGGYGVSAGCSGSPCHWQGPGGDGGDGGTGGTGGVGGNAGSGDGGAIYLDATGSVSMTNTTLSDNNAGAGFGFFFGTAPTPGAAGSAGQGGAGGSAGAGLPNGQDGATGYDGLGGSSGNPGRGRGGALAIADFNSSMSSELIQTTVAFNQTTAGTGGFWQGTADGAGISIGALDTLTVWNSIVASNIANVPVFGSSNRTQVVSNCHAGNALTLKNDNLDDDPSGTAAGEACGFDLHGDPHFAPPKGGLDAYAWGGNNLPVLMPVAPSPAIGGAALHGTGLIKTGGCALGIDERGVGRPYIKHVGSALFHQACDLGAVQNDIIFRNGFEP